MHHILRNYPKANNITLRYYYQRNELSNIDLMDENDKFIFEM